MRDACADLARLGGALRAHGVDTTLRDEIDAIETLGFVDRDDRDDVYLALRIALKIPRSAFDIYDRLFPAFFGEAPKEFPSPPCPRKEPPALPRGGVLQWDPVERRLHGGSAPAAEGDEPGYSPEALLRKKPFDELRLTDTELASMQRLLERLARRLAARQSRLLVPTRGRGQPDLRRSFRHALRTNGELLTLARRARKRDEPRLVFLCDTSGSMQAHSLFLMTFVLSLGRALRRKPEVFAFNTELVRLTPLLARPNLRLTLAQIEKSVPDWSGGTRIGESLTDFADHHLPRTVDAKTVVVILSDGLDRGDVELFADAVRRIQKSAKKLIWLSPLLGDPRYEPATRGLQAALPYIDVFAAAHNLESLELLIPELTRSGSRLANADRN